MILRHIIGLGIALTFTLIIFLGASFFGGVWTHYFAGEPEKHSIGEVSVKIIQQPVPHVGPCDKSRPCPAPHG